MSDILTYKPAKTTEEMINLKILKQILQMSLLWNLNIEQGL